MAPKEIELKMRLHPADANRAASFSALKGVSASKARSRTVYFDDEKHSILRKGYELRVRSIGNQTMQTVKRGSGVERCQWESEVADCSPSVQFLERAVREDLKGLESDLSPIFALNVERLSWPLHRGGAHIEFSIDIGELRAGQNRAQICEAELELKQGPTEPLFELAREFVRQFDAPISFLSKGERGYRLANGYGGGAKRKPAVELTDDVPASVAFQEIAAACVAEFSASEERLQLEGTDDSVHRTRIAVRRLRCAFSMFKSFVRGTDVQHVKKELKWFSELLGEARDLDMFFGERMKKLAQERPMVSGVAELEKEVRLRRDLAHERLMRAMHSERYRAMTLSTVECMQVGSWLDRASKTIQDEKIRYFAKHELQRRLAAILKKQAAIRGNDALKRHRLRIKAKKLRYMIELVQSAPFGASFRPVSKRLSRLQKTLGALNDSVAATRLLGQIVEDTPERSVLYASSLAAHSELKSQRSLKKKAIKAHEKLRLA